MFQIGIYSLDSLLDEKEMKARSNPEGVREGEYFSAAKVNTASDNINSSTRLRKRKYTNTHKEDSSKTSISKRRQGSMKEKLHELGALVPNITKMDKSSIIGGATTYMQELQLRAKSLQAQIADFEESEVDRPQQPSDQTPKKISAGNSYSSTTSKKIDKIASLKEPEVDKPKQPLYQTPKKICAVNSNSTSKKITKMEVARLGERGVNVKLVCNKGKGVAVSLYKALESFTSLDIESSKLVTVPEGFELTFSFKAGIKEVNLEKLKLGIAQAFLNHGFDFKTLPQP